LAVKNVVSSSVHFLQGSIGLAGRLLEEVGAGFF